MKSAEQDDIFDPDAALLASESEWEARLAETETENVTCDDCGASVDKDTAEPWNNEAGEAEGYRCAACYERMRRSR